MNYLSDLPSGISLQVFNNEELIFSSEKKWLHPLFELENFLKNFAGEKNNLSSHDSAIGKAAAVLSIRLGIKRIHAELISEIAKNFIEEYNKNHPETEQVQFSYKTLVPKLMCATENQLENMSDINEMYFLLRQRAKLVQGVDVKVTDICHDFISQKNISFDLKAGGHLIILGDNGAGKTTLLRLLAGIKNPTSGTILIDGKEISQLKKYTIGYVPQNINTLQYDLSVEEVVSLGIQASHSKKSLVQNALNRTSSLHLINRNFSSLSGGEKQKVQLSRCLAQNAKVLLLDEPTASLDSENRKMVVDILRSLTISEIPTIIVVTHDPELTKLRGWDILQLSETGTENAK